VNAHTNRRFTIRIRSGSSRPGLLFVNTWWRTSHLCGTRTAFLSIMQRLPRKSTVSKRLFRWHHKIPQFSKFIIFFVSLSFAYTRKTYNNVIFYFLLKLFLTLSSFAIIVLHKLRLYARQIFGHSIIADRTPIFWKGEPICAAFFRSFHKSPESTVRKI